MTATLDTEIVARIQRALNRQDLDAVAAELVDDVVFHPPAGMKGPLPAVRGREAVISHYAAQFEAQQGAGLLQRIEPVNAEALGGYVVAVAQVSMELRDVELSFQTVEVCRLEDGKVAERWVMFDRPDIPETILTEITRS